MSDQPLIRSVLAAVLADFHRDVVRPDIEQVVNTAVGQLRLDMNGHFDAVHARLDRLEDEYQAIKEGLRRLEVRHERLDAKVASVETLVLDLQAQVLELRTRLGRVEERLEELIALEERYPVRAEVQDLKTRIDRLQDDIRRLEQRLKP